MANPGTRLRVLSQQPRAAGPRFTRRLAQARSPVTIKRSGRKPRHSSARPTNSGVWGHRAGLLVECRQGSSGRFVESVGHLGVSANLIEAPPGGWTAFPRKYSTKYVVTAWA